MLKLSDEATTAQTELEQHLKAPVQAVTANVVGEPPAGFRRGYGEDAVGFAQKVARGVETSTEAILEIAKSIQEMKERLNRKEFSSFVRDMLQWLGADARKYLDIARAFDGFDLSRLSMLEPFTLLKLRAKKYAPIIEKLREEASITPLRVQELIKELLPKQPKYQGRRKAQTLNLLERHPNLEGGNFYFTLGGIPIPDEAGLFVESKLQNQTWGQIFEEMRTADLRYQVEKQETVSAVRDAHIELQREANLQRQRADELEREANLQRQRADESDRRIADLEAQLEQATVLQQPAQSIEIAPEPEPKPVQEPEQEVVLESVLEPEDTTQGVVKIKPADVAKKMLKCQTWADLDELLDGIAYAVNKRKCGLFVAALQVLNSQERQILVHLLAQHMHEFPLDQYAWNWLPDRCRALRDKAIALISPPSPSAI